MAEQSDWKSYAAAEYRSKREAALKKAALCAKAVERASARHAEAEQEVRDLDAGARVFGLDVVAVSAGGEVVAIEAKATPVTGEIPTPAPAPAGGASARDIVLTALKEVAPQPLKAQQLRTIIETQLGRPVHYKTSGMTLYRLAEAKLVHRRGTDWYYGPSVEPEPATFFGAGEIDEEDASWVDEHLGTDEEGSHM
jgi:hypothetical protein